MEFVLNLTRVGGRRSRFVYKTCESFVVPSAPFVKVRKEFDDRAVGIITKVDVFKKVLII